MLAEHHRRVREYPLERLDERPLCVGGSDGISVEDRDVVRRDRHLGVLWQLTKLLLEACSTVADVPLEMVTGFECLICHRADNFFHRKHASGMPGVLLRRAVRGN